MKSGMDSEVISRKIFISPMTEILNQLTIPIVFLHNKIKPNHYSHKYSKNTILLNNGYEGI